MHSEKELVKISKLLSLVLRHSPETIGIRPDAQGWTDVDTLIAQVNAHGTLLDKATLVHLVETNPKKRFAFNETFDRIRASQGHSVDVALGYENRQPPAVLYHGTGEGAVNAILETGIQKQGRQQVHLSADQDTAVRVGQRHGKPFVFRVLADQMYADGLSFFLSDNGVWLTDQVPVKYLEKEIEDCK
jgi:putative RNA 2'-phosphotransferase